jgi:hypothetical protein
MSTDPKLDLARWQPRELISSARTLSLPDFMLRCEAAFMLVVLVEAGDIELAHGLEAKREKSGDMEGLGFRTETRELTATLSGDVSVRTRAAHVFSEQTAERLPLGFARASCHVVPVCKRSDVSFLHHVSIGRARNHDIVLRHRSVSKFHAWLELTPDARLYVKDCDSSNHTYLNSNRVVDRAELQPGDTIKFGSVDARVCTSEGLWRLMRS